MSQQGQEPQLYNPDAPHEPISKWNPAFLLATWFGCGKIPFAPGTWGSLGALPFAYAIHSSGGAQMLLIASLVTFIVGVVATEVYMTATNTTHDSSEIVIDEVAGQMLLLTIFAPTLPAYITAFVIFRLLDIIKPWPINLLDRHVPGAFGVMIDDFAAGAIPIVLFFLILVFCAASGDTALVQGMYQLLGFDV